MTNTSITVVGNQWITKYLIEELISVGIKPSLIINMSAEKSEDISGYYDLNEIAFKHEIELYNPKTYSLKNEIDERYLSTKKIDLMLVFGWQRLIPEWFINQIPLGVFGVHGGPEKPPRCRGRAVFNWAILLGYSRFYMYLFRITSGVDEGSILKSVEFDINPFDDVLTLYHKNCLVSSKMFIEQIPLIISKTNSSIDQDKKGATYLPKRTPENGGIFWDWKAERIINLIRAVAPPYPGAFTEFRDQTVQIFKAHIFDTKITFENSQPGQIIEVFPNGDLIVMASDYPIYIREYCMENPKKIQKNRIFQLRSGKHIPDPDL